MQFFRFVFPFLFVRNWETGVHEVSWARVYIVVGIMFLCICSLLIAYMLQAPVVYTAPRI